MSRIAARRMSVFESHRWLGYCAAVRSVRFVDSLDARPRRAGSCGRRVAGCRRDAHCSRLRELFRRLLPSASLAGALLLAVQGIRPRFSYLYWSFMIGVFFNQLLPTTIGGDVARYQYTAAGWSRRRVERRSPGPSVRHRFVDGFRHRGIGVGAKQRDIVAGRAETRCGATRRRSALARVRVSAAGVDAGLTAPSGACVASSRARADRKGARWIRRFSRAIRRSAGSTGVGRSLCSASSLHTTTRWDWRSG